MKILNRKFYREDAATVAKKLLGCFLVTDLPDGRTVGKIVETESYLGKNDLASHSYKGETAKNAAMFGFAGHAYIYFIYGMYYCFNAVTGKKGTGEAVLIRALEPIEGIDLMKKRRGIDEIKNLTNGPSKLAQALGITKELNNIDLCKGPLNILSADSYPDLFPQKIEIVTTYRIGISQGNDLPLRFYIKGNKFVSKK